MNISPEEIKKTANLAKIAITEEEAKLYSAQLSAVLEWTGQLRQITSAPAAKTAKQEAAISAPLRADEPVLSPAAAQITAAFAASENNLLKVKKIL